MSEFVFTAAGIVAVVAVGLIIATLFGIAIDKIKV